MARLYRVYFQAVAFVDVQADDSEEAEELAMQVSPADYTINGWEMTDETVDVEAEREKEDNAIEYARKLGEKYRAEHPEEVKE